MLVLPVGDRHEGEGEHFVEDLAVFQVALDANAIRADSETKREVETASARDPPCIIIIIIKVIDDD